MKNNIQERLHELRFILQSVCLSVTCKCNLWFSPGTPIPSINKTDRHDITEILLKVVLNTRTLTLQFVC